MTTILYSQEIVKKVFTGETIKDGYMKAVKWYASHIIAKDVLHDIQVEYKKDNTANTIEMTLYAVLSAEEVMKQHCEVCREIHRSFFINEANNCNVCNAGAYERVMKQKMAVKVEYYKELLKRGGTYINA